MIKINLLDSITDKPIGATTLVDRRVSSPMSRFVVLAAVVGFLTFVAILGDYFWSSHNLAVAQKELDTQKQIAAQMEAVIKEQADLELKIRNIDSRIKAIKDLRSSQLGPSALLDALSERIAGAPSLYLSTINQDANNKLTILGNSPNEYSVTQFGQSLEFSDGVFSKLNISTNRQDIGAYQVGNSTSGLPSAVPETVNFTITCQYSPPKSEDSTATPAQQAVNGAPPGTTIPPPTGVQPPPVPPVAPTQPNQVAQK